MQLGEAEGPLGDERAEVLHERPDAPADAAEVVEPVGAAPDLEPVDHQLEALQRAQQRGRQQREVRERAGVDHVVAAAVAQQVQEHPQPEHERRQDPPARLGVQRHARARGHHPHALVEVHPLAALPTGAASGR